MSNIVKKGLIFVVSIFTIVGCQTLPNKNSSSYIESQKNTKYLRCTEPRPEMCTREYRPVCADVDTGIRCVKAPCPSKDRKEYSNACTACSDSKVYGYILGNCNK